MLCVNLGLAWMAGAAEKTAFELAKEGNRYISAESKDRVVQIHSDKSVGSLTPTIWYVVYYDPDSTTKAVEVKFGAGEKLAVNHTARIMASVAGKNKDLPKDKLKVDSDKAIEIAKKEPLLKNLTLTATRLTLEPWGGMPVWKVRLWAAKLSKPNKSADLGEVFVAAEDGKVLKNDLKINRVD